MPKSEDRAAEFNRLIVEQAWPTRSMKYGWEPDDDAKATIQERAARLIELAELLDMPEPEKYVNERIAAWLKLNPLSLTSERVHEVIESFRKPNPDTRVQCDVFIAIGDLSNGGYYYRVMADDLESGHALVFRVPESVAEHFRQQGRRALQAELRGLLNSARA